MQFAFTEDQLAFRDAVRDLLTKECPPEVVRAAWPEGPDAGGAKPGEGARGSAEQVDAVWQALADMGVLGIAVPEDQGGLGLSEVDWVLLADETGYAALPHPFVETTCVAAPLLAAAGDPDGALPDLIEGRRRATCLLLNPRMVPIVPWADHSDLFLWLDVAFTDEPRVLEVLPPGGLTDGSGWVGNPTIVGAVAPLDGSRHSTRVGEFTQHTELATGTAATEAYDRMALGTAAQLVGLGRRMLDLSVAYAIERKQFGVPIGSQQAVKHHLADAALQLQFAAPAVYRAAWSLSTGADTASRDVSMAKAMASDAARLVGRKALQVHGAIGYTVEYDLHLYLKRAEALARAWGDAAWHRRRVADALGI